ncbi:MAG: copper resistance protein CopC/CopD [Thermoleophilia bacterium]|nr:copper resistance protein CopC/CopD [Thermoleophilia bacterium]
MALLLLPATGAAHARMRGVERIDTGLRLSFGAPVESAFLEVFVRRGGVTGPVAARVDPVDPQAVLVPLPTPRTDEMVTWRVLSQDGHVTSGRYITVPMRPGPDGVHTGENDDAAGAGDWIAGIGRGLALLGGILALGLVAFRRVVVDAAVASGGLAPPGAPPAEGFRERAGAALGAVARTWRDLWRRALDLSVIGAVIVAAGTLVALDDAGLGTLLRDTRLGTGLLVIAVAAVAGGALDAASRRRAGAEPPWFIVAMAVPPAAVLGAMSWMGHASSGNDATLNIGADMVHNAATAAWIGGLLGLAAYLLPAGAALDAADRVRLVAQGVVRFSALATIAVTLLVITGVYRALAEVAEPGDLVGTAYGVTLVVKLGIFVVMLAAGGYNRFVLHPRLERAALGLPRGEAAAAERLAASVRAELVLAGLLLAAVAVLVSNAPTV